MSKTDDIGPMGIIDKGDAFELRLPTQVQISVQGSFKSAVDSYVETELNWLSGSPRSMIVSRTDIAAAGPSRFSNGAAMRLEPGKYSFLARIRSRDGGVIAAPNIETAKATLYDDLQQGGTLGAATAYGSNNGFVTVSHKDERQVHAALRVFGKPTAGERVYATLRLLDIASGEIVAAPRVIQVGTVTAALESIFSPTYIKPARLYRLHYDLIYSGQAEMGVAVSFTG